MVTVAGVVAGARVLHARFRQEYEYGPWDECDREPFLVQAREVLEAAADVEEGSAP